MIYYINATPSATGNYGNPNTRGGPGKLALPEALLPKYIAARGFVIPTVVNDTVAAVAVNQEALDAYLAEHPDGDPPQEPEEEQTASVWEELDAAYQEGVNSVE